MIKADARAKVIRLPDHLPGLNASPARTTHECRDRRVLALVGGMATAAQAAIVATASIGQRKRPEVRPGRPPRWQFGSEPSAQRPALVACGSHTWHLSQRLSTRDAAITVGKKFLLVAGALGARSEVGTLRTRQTTRRGVAQLAILMYWPDRCRYGRSKRGGSIPGQHHRDDLAVLGRRISMLSADWLWDCSTQ